MKRAKQWRLGWRGILCVIGGTIPVCVVFDHFGKLSLMMPTFTVVFVIGFVIVLLWRMRVYSWFWMALAVVALLHVFILLRTTWPDRWIPGAAYAGIGSLDIYAILAMLLALEKLNARTKQNES